MEDTARARREPSLIRRPHATLLARQAEGDILPFAARHGIGVIVYSPMYSGLLSGKMTREGIASLPPDDWRSRNRNFQEPLLSHNSATVELRLRILDASTGKLKEDFAPVDAAPYERPGSSVLRIARKVPIDQLPKGTYRLEVQVMDSTGRSTAWRAANFAVE